MIARLGQQRQGIGGERRRDEPGERRGTQAGQDATRNHVRPNSPVGRSARISAIGAKSVK